MKEILAGNFVPAEHLLQQASEINEESTTLYAASWAVLLALRDREEEAISILEERLATHSTDGNLLLAYGITLEKQGLFEDAEDAFREVISRDPNNPGALRGLSAVAHRKGQLVEAATLAVRAFSEVPDNAIFAKTAADRLEAIQQPKTAFEVLEMGALYNPEDEELVSRALKGCLANNLIDRARDILTIVDINQPWAAGWKASFLDWQGERDKADELIARTLARPAGNDTEFLFQCACIMMRREEVEAAEQYVERILAQDPQHTGALRIRADLSLGRTDLDGAIDPLRKAFSLSPDALTGWRLFWSCTASSRWEEAEDTLAALSEDEDLMADMLESMRLELAGVFLEAAQGEDLSVAEFANLDMLPNEASAGLLLEFLEAVEDYPHSTPSLQSLYGLLFEELGRRDPLLRLHRLYARSNWERLESALEDLRNSIEDGEPALGFEQSGSVYRLYGLLTALAKQDLERVERSQKGLDAETRSALRHILGQKTQRNPLEQRWLDGALSPETPAPTPDDTLASRAASAPAPTNAPLTGVPLAGAPFTGGILDHRDAVEVIYETEDGEVITDLQSGDYEIIDDEDEDDDEWEYIWVEEEVPVATPAAEPKETYDDSSR